VKTTKKNIRSYVKYMLGHDSYWASKALVKIYENQTGDEQVSKTTRWMNGLGFSGTDAELLTSFAQQYLARGFLSQKQWQILFRRMPKYHKQIIAISNPEKLKGLVEKFQVAEQIQIFEIKIKRREKCGHCLISKS